MRHGSWVKIVLCSRKVTFEEGMKFAKDNDLIFMEVSAKTAYQVEEAFKRNAELLLDKVEKGVIDLKNDPPGIKVGNLQNKSEKIELQSETNKPEQKKKRCCGGGWSE